MKNAQFHLFAERVVNLLQSDPFVIGLAAGGSWITHELDEFSDIDFVLVTKEAIGGHKEKMMAYAHQFGHLLNAFTGEHVGEPRLLICLYDDPLLHVDIKFVTLTEFEQRVETPVLLLDKEGQLQAVLDSTTSQYPYPDYQWIEDRFWIWIHYTLLKVNRGEYFETLESIGYMRNVVLGPLLHIKNGNLPRRMRRVEMHLPGTDISSLKGTLADYDKASLLDAIQQTIQVYQQLRKDLFTTAVHLHQATEEKVIAYYEQSR